MKKLLLLLTLFASCKEKEKSIFNAGTQYLSVTDASADTVLHQDVLFMENKYFLDTWITTHKDDERWRQNLPYNKRISGSFEFIKEQKNIEYLKAFKILVELKRQGEIDRAAKKIQYKIDSIAQDSIEILKKLPVELPTVIHGTPTYNINDTIPVEFTPANTGVYSDTARISDTPVRTWQKSKKSKKE